jgi:lysophospholipase L1-like esterase
VADRTSVHIHGVGGRKIHSILQFHLAYVDRIKPDLVILLVGGNDVQPDTTPEEIVYKMISLVTLLHNAHHVKAVILCQILPRFPRFQNWFDYNVKSCAINHMLDAEFARFPYARLWYHARKFSFPDPARVLNAIEEGDDIDSVIDRSKYLADGIHLLPTGQYLLYKSVRGAILYGLNLLQVQCSNGH